MTAFDNKHDDAPSLSMLASNHAAKLCNMTPAEYCDSAEQGEIVVAVTSLGTVPLDATELSLLFQDGQDSCFSVALTPDRARRLLECLHVVSIHRNALPELRPC